SSERKPQPPKLKVPFVHDDQLTRCMRLRVQSLQQKKGRPQDGEKLLQPNEHVYRVDFLRQHNLRFLRWDIQLEKCGKLLEPVGIFWKKPGAEEVECNEADAQEFGERLVELARIRKVMYFLLAFTDGLEPAQLKGSIVFKA
uniref:Olfactory marker protein n=1 Tax=Anas platyrhynchos TaxID=8839 RepID=A0A8B9SH59_ANAPL